MKILIKGKPYIKINKKYIYKKKNISLLNNFKNLHVYITKIIKTVSKNTIKKLRKPFPQIFFLTGQESSALQNAKTKLQKYFLRYYY